MRKIDIQRHLGYYLWCYLGILIFSIVFWTTVYGIVGTPDANEKLTISYFGNDYDVSGLKSDVEDNLSSITSQNIKEFSFDEVRQTENIVFGSMIQTRLYSSDIMIFEEWVINEDFVYANFRSWTSDLESRFSDLDVEYYQIDGLKCGIILDPKGGDSNIFTKYYDGDSRLILFFAPYCENLGGAYGIGNEEDDGAIELMRFLLEETHGEEK